MGKKSAPALSSDKMDRNALAKRRREAIGLYRKGWTQYRIAKKVGVSFEAVSNWVEVFEKDGMQAVISIGKPGPKPTSNQTRKKKERVRASSQVKLSPRKNGDVHVKNVFDRLFKLIGNKE